MTMQDAQRAAVRTLVFAILAVAGCHAPHHIHRSSTPLNAAQASGEADALWEAIKASLRANRFRLDRVDRSAGVITTSPMSSQHFFEFWRHDVDTFNDWLDATMNPVRRRVTVHLSPDGAGRWTQLTVEVKKERFSGPDRQFNSTGAAYEFFGNRLPSTTGKARVEPEDEKWIDAGRDPAMEDFLLQRIMDQSPLDVIADAGPSTSAADSPPTPR